MRRIALFFGLFWATMFVANAQSATPGVQARQQNQVQRIHQGVKNGELTPQEARGLAAQQKHIQLEKKIAKRDGVITPREKRHIRRDQRQANKQIYRQKHDAQSRN